MRARPLSLPDPRPAARKTLVVSAPGERVPLSRGPQPDATLPETELRPPPEAALQRGKRIVGPELASGAMRKEDPALVIPRTTRSDVKLGNPPFGVKRF